VPRRAAGPGWSDRIVVQGGSDNWQGLPSLQMLELKIGPRLGKNYEIITERFWKTAKFQSFARARKNARQKWICMIFVQS